MSSPKDVLDIIRAYLDRHQQSQATYSQLLSFADRYILENPAMDKSWDDFRKNLHRNLSGFIDHLELTGDLRVVRKDGTPTSLVFPAYFAEKISGYYDRADEKPELPFPNEDSLSVNVPLDLITTVDIKNDFMTWLTHSNDEEVKILKINFPDGIASMIATPAILPSKVLLNAVHRIRHYLRDPKNLSYTRQKLIPLLRTRELAVKDMLHSIVTTPETSAQSIFEPTDFTFHLWTQLSTNIIKEYGPKADKLAEEHGFCQAAYLLGYYNVFYRGKQQKKKEEDLAFNVFLQMMRRPPYAFKISDIYEFKDDKGILVTKRVEKEKLASYLQEKLVPSGKKDIPDFLKVRTPKNDELYLLYASVVPLVSEGLLRAQKEMREFYSRSWMLSLKQDVEFTSMHSDDEFRNHIENRLKNHYPLLYCLLNYQTLFFAARIDGLNERQRADLMELINTTTQKVKSWDSMFRLSRKKLLEDAKMLLPAWMVIPVVRGMVRVFRNLFLGKELANKQYGNIFDHEGQERIQLAKKKKKSDETASSTGAKNGENNGAASKNQAAANNKQQVAQFREAAKALESDFLPPGAKLAPTLDSLAERWNPLLDPSAKKNLREDVNSLTRDFLRKTRITSKSKLPGPDDVKSYAQKVWEADSLLAIRNRKDLLRYLELYIIHLLENMN